jgi:hypothetical protein
MRARDLRGVVPVLIAGAGLGLWGGLAHAEGSAPEPGAAASAGRVPTPNVPAAPSRRSQDGEQQQAWWARAREVLFRDLELSPEQARAMDEILESQQKARARAQELQAELGPARRERNAARSAALQEELRAIRAELTSPHTAIEEMRALLSDAQRPTFDMNRAHLVAEGQKSPKAQPAQRTKPPARRPAAGAGTDAE